MIGADRVLESGVLRTRKHHISESELFDAAQTEEIRMFHDVVKQAFRNPDKTKYRIVYDLIVQNRVVFDYCLGRSMAICSCTSFALAPAVVAKFSDESA